MGRRKEVKLHLDGGSGTFFVSGTEIIEKMPFEVGDLRIEGEGFKISIALMKTPIKGQFRADTTIEYTEEIKQWR